MELSIDLNNIEKGLHELFKYAFTNNCLLDDESVTEDERKTLDNLDPSEVLENFKDLVLGLLKFKREYKASDKAELAQRSEQFETLLQKMEAEVRTHIRIEHQLKLHIENHQNRIDELEKAEVSDKALIKELEEKCSKKSKSGETEKIKKEMEDKCKGLVDLVEKKEKLAQKMEIENSKLRHLLEEKVKECEGYKKEILRASKVPPRGMNSSGSIEQLKRKIEMKKMQSSLKEKTSTDMRAERKSMAEPDYSKLSLSPYMKKEYVVSSKKEGIKYIRGHIRSSSEQHLLNSKRTPSR